MTPERFSELVAAYGGSPQRWPENERTAALDFIAANPAQAEAALAPAVELDDLLSRIASQLRTTRSREGSSPRRRRRCGAAPSSSGGVPDWPASDWRARWPGR
ncbi:hypothetical protein [Mesorhizobium sp.]|uniref:hypothetical protein n=1 Tax=Mesorhizobium sp. TaxID=1871066 RepID=UPI00121140D6|nr:hypothetical protein [Mesorhizobium sp.]TIN09144.1 MAG: hypothetical protein E5Y14_16910 [Mesorhizobium sp.]